jgi:hypothetical protein
MATNVKRSIGNLIREVSPSPSMRWRGVDFRENTLNTSSFRYDAPGSPLRSTQQIPLDWADFSKHVFFGSAEVSVNVAFDKIINGFPFDGQQSEVYDFLDSLTGFEKHVYDEFPKSLNYLHFSQSQLSVNDVAGGAVPALSRRKDGENVLDPGMSSFSVQFKMLVPSQSNDNQVLLQRISSSSGYSLVLSSSANSTTGTLMFFLTSGSAELQVSTSYTKGAWVDVCAQMNRRPTVNRAALYLDGKLAASSSNAYEFQEMQARGTYLTVGSGTRHSATGFDFLPMTSLSASMDDLKFFIGNRTQSDIHNVSKYGTGIREDLKLCYRFNEPYGSYAQNDFVLDSSGNGLHTRVINFGTSLKDGRDGLPFFYERLNESPVLFPEYSGIVDLNTELLTSASDYDSVNPNIITKLIPPHYLVAGQISQGFETEEGPIAGQYPESGELPRESKLGSSQILSSLLYIWAKQFDEYKIFVDQFSKLETLDPVSTGSIADTFLPLQANSMGFELPKLFTPSNTRESTYGDDVGIDPSAGKVPLTEIQAQVWRRIVSNFPDIIRSKGTIYSVKSLIRSFGVNPDTSIRVREYGGAQSGFISGRSQKRSVIGEISASGSWVASSPFLSSSRVEPGHPLTSGSMSSGLSSVPSDGLHTSGSWNWEGLFTYPLTRAKSPKESLVRFYTTGSSGKSLLLNLVCTPSGTLDDGSAIMTLYGAYSGGSDGKFVTSLTGSKLFDGSRWHVSLGREKISETRSKWYLRTGKENNGEIEYSAESLAYVTCSNPTQDVFSNISNSYNRSGSFFVIGNESSIPTSAQFIGTNYPVALTGSFSGKIANVRFYSKDMDTTEWLEHVRNVDTLGVNDPLRNFNFVTTASGSFSRLRIDVPMDQETKNADGAGRILLFDYSQNNYHLSGSGFTSGTLVIGNTDVIYSSLEPKFDERSSTEKVRVRSWQSFENVQRYGGEIGPVYEVPRNEEGSDDTRFGIEISAVQGLNEDIMRMFADYTPFDNAIGSPSTLFDESYVELEDMRDIYFNRLTDSLDIQNVFLFAKWFEGTVGSLVEQVLPANTRYFGTNFVVESHVLERNRMRYYWGDIYLGENDRRGLRGTIGLSQLLASVKRN